MSAVIKDSREAVGFWTAERTSVLERMWRDGASAAEIAATLGTVSRNATYGKALRLGLAGRNGEARHLTTREIGKKNGRLAKPKLNRSGADPLASARAAAEGRKSLKGVAWSAISGSDPVAMIDLEPHHCRWPIGDRPTLFCGMPKAESASYCEHHARLSRART